MLFSSSIFIFLFLPASLIGYQLLSPFGRPAMLAWLTFTSLFFYGYWNPVYLALLLSSMLINFFFASRIGSGGRSEASAGRWLAIAVVVNLLVLGYYKYLFPVLNFFNEHSFIHHGFAGVVLPLGISFFTFTQIAYLSDLRQGAAKRQGLLSYSVFVTFFPHLIAGPIIHPREVMPQLEQGRIHGLRLDELSLGATWFVMGLAKKVLIADRVAPLADVLYAHPHNAGFATSWLGAVTYAMQLYFDFSGYSDMALGLARMFSITFPFNFNSPLKAEGIIDFWQRFHMTLSRYLNEYLYTPILRWVNRRRIEAGKKVSSKAATTPEGFVSMVAFPLITTMFLGGIWHGAGLQFVVWGLLQGFFLTVNRAWRVFTPNGHPLHKKLPAPLMVLVNMLCFVVSQVFFRAASVGDAAYILGTMAGLHRKIAFSAFPYLSEIPPTSKFMMNVSSAMLALGVCLFIVWAMPNTQEILGQLPEGETRKPSLLPRLSWTPSILWSLGIAALFLVSILMLDASKRFLYFQF
jgi:alginate O-acetyltransferase complex protein AlgI